MINTVVLHGRITADPELRHTTSDTAVCSFTVAVDDGYGENKKTYFIECVAWQQAAEFVSKYFTKGQEIFLRGKLQTRSWEDKEGNKRKSTEVVVEKVDFSGSKASQSDSRAGQGNYTRQAQQAPQRAAQGAQRASQQQASQQDDFLSGFADSDSDLPF